MSRGGLLGTTFTFHEIERGYLSGFGTPVQT
jgi:hypothetical protein